MATRTMVMSCACRLWCRWDTVADFCSAGTGSGLLPGCGKTGDETACVRLGVARKGT